MKLPAPVLKWANKHEPKKDGLDKESFWQQIDFVFETLPPLITNSQEALDSVRNHITVISENKTIICRKPSYDPLFQITHPNGLVITLCWLGEWVVSFQSTTPITADFGKYLFINKKVDIGGLTECMGKYLFGSYSKNNKEFSIECTDDYRLYTVLWLIGQNLKIGYA